MSAHLKYLKYVLRHKWFVFLACLKLHVPIWQAIIHDWDKFLPDEWFPYVENFYDKEKQGREGLDAIGLYGLAELAPFGFYVKDRFDVAWLLHQKRNKHHWQFWILVNDTDGTYPLPIPENHLREMLADWIGAGQAISGRSDPSLWYDKNKAHMVLHPETRQSVEKLLKVLSDSEHLRG